MLLNIGTSGNISISNKLLITNSTSYGAPANGVNAGTAKKHHLWDGSSGDTCLCCGY